MMLIVFTIPFAVTLRVKFEETLEPLNDMVPFEGLMLMKLIESSDPKLESFSREYDKLGVVVAGRHTWVVKRKLNCHEMPLT